MLPCLSVSGCLFRPDFADSVLVFLAFELKVGPLATALGEEEKEVRRAMIFALEGSFAWIYASLHQGAEVSQQSLELPNFQVKC